MTSTNYVLDTCVLLADPHAPLRFDEHDVVLPLVVVEELDRQKSRMDEVGANARSAIRLLEDLGASESGGLAAPTDLPGGGSLRIELNGITSDRLPDILDPTTVDHRILATCLNLVDDGSSAVLVTKDAALRIKGAQLGVPVEDYRGDTVPVDESYSGVAEIDVAGEVVDELFGSGKVVVDAPNLVVNQFVVLHGPGSQSGLGRVVEDGSRTVVTRVRGS
ncbi:MAG: PIN domain-containing protein, partial [Actinomycetota bacterium]